MYDSTPGDYRSYDIGSGRSKMIVALAPVFAICQLAVGDDDSQMDRV